MKTLKDKIFAGLILLMALFLAYGSYYSFQEEKGGSSGGDDGFDSFQYKDF